MLPVSLCRTISVTGLALRDTLGIVRIRTKRSRRLLPLRPKALTIVYQKKGFRYGTLKGRVSVITKRIFLTSIRSIDRVSHFSRANFRKVIVCTNDSLLVGQRHLVFQAVAPSRLGRSKLCVRLVRSRVRQVDSIHIGIIRSLLHTLVFFLRRRKRLTSSQSDRIPPFFRSFTLLVEHCRRCPICCFTRGLKVASTRLGGGYGLRSNVSTTR